MLALIGCGSGNNIGNTPGNINNDGLAAIQGNRIYYVNPSDGHSIYSMRTDGSDKQKLNDDGSVFINVVGDRIYYIGGKENAHYIYSMKTDGTDRQKLNDDNSKFVNVVGGRIYYVNNSDGLGRIHDVLLLGRKVLRTASRPLFGAAIPRFLRHGLSGSGCSSLPSGLVQRL
jgi:tricorn protease-like protein